MIAGLYNYWIVIVLMMTGFYIVISHDNFVKKLVGLSIFQTSVFILFISMGKVQGGTAPILSHAASDDQERATAPATTSPGDRLPEPPPPPEARVPASEVTLPPEPDRGAAYSNPLPHVLILTAIVVGVATTALGLALVVRIKEEFGTVEGDEILPMERSA